MMRLLIVSVLALTCFSAGCTKYWYQEGTTFTECEQDHRACLADMHRYRDTVQHSLGVYEDRFEKDCMTAKGYRLVKEKQLPFRVRRRAPAGRGNYGVAGTIDE